MTSCDLDDIEDFRPIEDDYLPNFNEHENCNSNFTCGPESTSESIIPGKSNFLCRCIIIVLVLVIFTFA